MKLCLFLHLHQPPTQYPEVVTRVTQESYQRIFELLNTFPQAKLTLNISASLSQQLSPELIGLVKTARERAQIELTQTAAYHPLLVYLSTNEVRRQIQLNAQISRKIFGFEFGPGFFPPEMAVNDEVLSLIAESGCGWVVVDERALADRDLNHLVFLHPIGLKLIRRHWRLSTAVAFSQIRHVGDLLLRAKTSNLEAVVLAMDGETFGHHRPEQMEFLSQFLALTPDSGHQLLTLSELINQSSAFPVEGIKFSSWGDSFDRWQNPQNPVHQLQWQLYNLALKAVSESSGQGESTERARGLLDKGLHSDQFWWAAKNPCWHYPMLERGAKLLLEAVQALPGEGEKKIEAQSLYKNLTQTAIELYGNTVIAC